MNIDEIKSIISNSQKSNDEFSLNDISNISQKVKFTLEMDREKQIYFYQITKYDLENSSLIKEDIENLVKDGWRYNNDKDIFFKNV
jgi:hypothetical protein